MRDTSIVDLNKRVFIHCLCHLELGVLQQLKLLQGLGMVHRPQIFYDSYSSHKVCSMILLFVLQVTLIYSKVESGIYEHAQSLHALRMIIRRKLQNSIMHVLLKTAS